MFYIGSCRYMKYWDHFPARLHTTREIIFFLENIKNLKEIEEYPRDLANCIWGDIYHPGVISESIRFMSTPLRKYTKVVVEISSRKVMYYRDIPVNHYYADVYKLAKPYALVEKILTPKEIEDDIVRIQQLCTTLWGATLHIIPHLNLKTRSIHDYIPERKLLVDVIETVCLNHSIRFHNIGKYLESIHECFLEECMSNSSHYYDYTHINVFVKTIL